MKKAVFFFLLIFSSNFIVAQIPADDRQKTICQLTPYFHFAPGQKFCNLLPITFYDSTTTSSTIVKFYWDFGDYSGIDSIHPSPTHIYLFTYYWPVTYTVITADGCTATYSKMMTIGGKPSPSFLLNGDCGGSSQSFHDQTYYGLGSPGSYYWDLYEGITSNLANPVITYATIGNKSIKLVVESAQGCISDTFKQNVIIYERPKVHFTSEDSTCVNTPVNFYGTAIAQSPILSWGYNFGDGTVALSQNATHTYTTPGSFLVMQNAYVAGPFCAGISVKTVFIAAKPVAKFTVNALCQFSQVKLIDSSYVKDAVPIKGWWWDLGNGQYSHEQHPTVTYNSSGYHTIKLVVVSRLGCLSDTFTKTIYIQPVPGVISLNFSNSCINKPVNFSATDSSGTITNWNWQFGDGGTGATQNVQHSFASAGTYSVRLTATASGGCYNKTIQKAILISDARIFAGNDTLTNAGQPFQLHAVGGINYTWTPASYLNDANAFDPIGVITHDQLFTVKGKNSFGCEGYDEVLVKIYKGPDIYLPNAFTPNDDGTNDFFVGKPVGIDLFSYLKIFNRYGQEIFSTTDYRKGWDGKWKGQKQEAGVYVYIARGIDFHGNAVLKKGTVMLIR